MKYLVANADDFGASGGINMGIVQAHREGILSSASLMVNMPCAFEAAALSRHYPNLSVGLHVNFTNEGDDPVVDVSDASACRVELNHQFELFLQLMDRVPTHLDSHHHVHRRPHLLPLFLELAERAGVPLREHSPVRYFSKFYGQWGDGLPHLDWISAENLLHMLEEELQDGYTELGCHPGYVDPHFHSIYGIEREEELRTLCDPRVRKRLEEWNVVLVGFGSVSIPKKSV